MITVMYFQASLGEVHHGRAVPGSSGSVVLADECFPFPAVSGPAWAAVRHPPSTSPLSLAGYKHKF